MNYIIASITEIKSVENISIVKFLVDSYQLSMMSLELDDSIEVGKMVKLGAKGTNISLSKGYEGELSVSNQLPSRVNELVLGELLCRVKLDFVDFEIESIITKDSALRMNLQKGDQVYTLIKSSELSIIEVL